MNDTYLEQKYDISHKCSGCDNAATCIKKTEASLYLELASKVQESAFITTEDKQSLAETMQRFVKIIPVYTDAIKQSNAYRNNLLNKPKFESAFKKIEENLCLKLVEALSETDEDDDDTAEKLLNNFTKYFRQVTKFRDVYNCINKEYDAYLDTVENLYSIVDLGLPFAKCVSKKSMSVIQSDELASASQVIDTLESMKLNKECLKPLNELLGWIHLDYIPMKAKSTMEDDCKSSGPLDLRNMDIADIFSEINTKVKDY